MYVHTHNPYVCTNLEVSGVLKKREVVRLRSDSVDGVYLNSPTFGVQGLFEFIGFT